MPGISVVIPVKDDAEPLHRCLRALAAQSRLPDEVVVVDNGSTDDSAAVALAAGARVVRCESPGIPAASARGFDVARGDILLRIDADCVPAVGWVDGMADAFDRRPDAAAFTGAARFIDGPRMLRRPLAAAYLLSYAAATAPALGHLPLFGSNLGLRAQEWRRIRDDVHRTDDVHDDLDLAFHIGRHARVSYVPGAAMGVSMRPFADARSFARRVRRGVRTVVAHWPEDFPPVRWMHRGMRRYVAGRRSRARR
ncbi:glycosyltransferase family A protein [Microbacterium sp. RD1]|uniref:glycosyltransferase family A protein n=1 Tax=Microbacterium sp. RD1 TaxID=3457313 RepID=UPI003FA5E43D